MATKMGPIKLKKPHNNTVIVKDILFPYHMVIINTSNTTRFDGYRELVLNVTPPCALMFLKDSYALIHLAGNFIFI